MQSRGKLVFLVLPLLCCLACKQNEPPINTPADVAQYASLPGLTDTHNAELQAELARLLAEQATPLQLMGDASRSSSNQPRLEAVPDASSAAARLDVIFPPNFRDSARERLDQSLAGGRIRVYSGDSVCCFDIDQALSNKARAVREGSLGGGLSTAGRIIHLGCQPTRPTSTPSRSAIGSKGLYAAELIAGGDPEAAVEPLRLMLRVSELLAHEKSITSRGAGAVRRGEALQVLEGIARHPAATPSVHRQLKMLLDQQLERWPDDANAWIGDRAQGLHTYELVRDGYLLSLLTYDELREYRDEIGIEQLAEVVAEQHRSRRVVLLAHDAGRRRCLPETSLRARPSSFGRSKPIWNCCAGRDNYPFVADQLLLLQLDQGSRLMALDRARCEAWALALHIACGSAPPSQRSTRSPATSSSSHVTETQVVVDAVDPESGLPAAIVRDCD